jgi:cytochrome c biogenesis protein CcdA
LLPLILVSLVMPFTPMFTLMLLRRERGRLLAGALLAGMTTVRVLQGLVFGFMLSEVDNESGADDSHVATGIVFVIFGILLLNLAARKLAKAGDPDAQPPKWMAFTDRLTVVGAFGLGAGYLIIAVKHWVITLGAIAVLHETGISTSQSVVLFAIFVIGAQLLGFAPLFATMISEQRSSGPINAANAWLTKHSGAMSIVLSVVFGVYFLLKGVGKLAGG